MGETLSHMATEISSTQNNFSLWDRGQFIVLLSRNMLAKTTIFVKTDNLNELLNIIIEKTAWSDYMDQVLDIITLNSSKTNKRIPSRKML